MASTREDINLLDVFITLAKHKRVIIVLPMLVGALAGGISLLLPNIYIGTTRILPPQQSQASATTAVLGNLGGLAGLAGGQLGLKNPADLYVGMLKSRTVADNIIGRFDLKRAYGAKTFDEARKELESRSKIGAGKEGMITIEFEDSVPASAANIANAYVEELDRLTQSLAITEASQRRLFFEKQVRSAQQSLVEAESALRKTQERTGLIKLDEQGKAIIESAARLQAEIVAKEVQLRAMRSFATEKNPDYLVIQEQLNGLKAELRKQESSRTSERGHVFLSTGNVPEAGLEYVRRLRDVKYQEAMYEVLARQYELARIDEAKDAPLIQIVDRAVTPDRKSKPARSVIALLAALVTFVFCVLWAFIKDLTTRMEPSKDYAARISILRQYLWRKK